MFPGSCYPVIVVYVVHVDPVSWHPTFLVILLGTPKPLLGLLDIVQRLLENLCEVFQEKVANTFWKFEVPVQRKPVESHTPCLVVSIFISIYPVYWNATCFERMTWPFAWFPSPTDVSPTESSWMLRPLNKASLGYYAPDRCVPTLDRATHGSHKAGATAAIRLPIGYRLNWPNLT